MLTSLCLFSFLSLFCFSFSSPNDMRLILMKYPAELISLRMVTSTIVSHIPSNDEFGDIARDINLASEKLQQALERGDFAENSKEQLVLNLAHDLRTPLTSVLGYLDFILQDDQLTAEQIKHYTSIAFTKSQRLEKLIDELFEITRMNYGKLTIEKKPIDLSELLIQLNEELYPCFREK